MQNKIKTSSEPLRDKDFHLEMNLVEERFEMVQYAVKGNKFKGRVFFSRPRIRSEVICLRC